MRASLRLAAVGGAALALGAGAAFGAAAGTQRQAAQNDTLVFAGSADPIALDGALVSDGESVRAIYQIFETLVGEKPGTTKIVPLLATKWKASNGGKKWTFTIRQGVKFQDGTPFDAAAVCTNFNRWYNFTGSFQNPSATYYWQNVFGGFKTYNPKSGAPKASLYKSCTAPNASTAVINLTKPSSSFLAGLTLPAFSIASPTALKQYNADAGTVDSDGVFHPTGTFATQHPVGTGPFKLQSWTVGDKLVLVRNDEYWGPKAKLASVIIRPIADNAARLQALQTGEIQGYDNVDPQDIKTVQRDSNLKIVNRPPFNVGYVGFNQAGKSVTKNPLVRQAIAYGLDRKTVVSTFYAGRGTVANQFLVPNLFGYSKTGIKNFPYNPSKAKALLQKAGLKLPVKLDFWYPTSVSRPYMPDPARNFQAFQASLDKSGFKVVPHSAPWSPDYVGNVNAGKAGDLYLFGWTGDFGDPDDFLGVFFQQYSAQWGFHNPKIFALLNRAERETNPGRRTRLYQQASRQVMQFLPGVPYVYAKPALAFRRNVQGFVASPTLLDSFATVSLGAS
jgi:peptide/nickel transport system substrate-binding protein